MTEARETSNNQQTWKQTFGYDRFGNRNAYQKFIGTTQVTLDNKTFPQIDATTNRFLANQGYAYDSGGNLVTDADGRQFTFNGDNKQTLVKDVNNNVVGTYFYDGEGKRVKKVTNLETTIFVYSAGKLVAEYSTAAPPSNPTTSYTATDQLGSPRVITNAFGQVTSRRDFMPFGEELYPDTVYRKTSDKYGATDSVRQRFTGYQKDTETGLDFAEARYYNNQHGRFTAIDPLLASGKSANPQTFNRYVYVGNNSLNGTDPSGRIPEWVYDNTAPTGTNRPTWVSHEEFEKGGYEEWKDTNYTLNNGDVITLDRQGPISIEGVGNYLGWSRNGVVQGTGVYDSGYSTVKNINTFGGWASSATQHSFQFPALVPEPGPVVNWTGKNGQTFSLLSNPKFYGNQYTGSRTVAIAAEEATLASRRANYLSTFSKADGQFKAIKLLGRTGFFLTSFFAVADGRAAYHRGDTAGGIKAGADGVMGGVGFFGGPPGAAASIIYNGVDIIDSIPDPGFRTHKFNRQILTNRLGPEQ